MPKFLEVTNGIAARAALGSPRFIDVAAAPYNLTPSTANPEVVIQQALDYAAGNGIPEVIISRPGTYTIGGFRRLPGQVNGQVHAAIWGRSNLKLTMKPGVVLKLANNITTPVAATQTHIISTFSPYSSSPSSAHIGWVIEGGVIDGNAANQSTNVVHSAIFLGMCRNSYVRDVVVKGIWGNTSTPPNETYAFEAHTCRDVAFINCTVDGSDSAYHSTGFSADNSFGVTWTGCTSYGMDYGMGFTAYQCSGLQYANCRAYRNSVGFNLELSEFATYSGCVSGGTSPTLAGGVVSIFFNEGQEDLGNAYGVQIQGCSDITLNGCVISENDTANVLVKSINGVVCSRVIFSGCLISGTGNAVTVESAATGGSDQVEVHFLGCAVNDGTVTGGNYLQTWSTTDVGTPGIYALGGSPSIGINLGTKGAGAVNIRADTANQPKIKAAGPATDQDLYLESKNAGVIRANGTVLASGGGSNYLQIETSSATPGIFALGGTDVGINLGTKGTGGVFVRTETGQTPTITASGPDTNHDLHLKSKNAGVVKINDATAMTTQVVSVNGSQTLGNVAGRHYVTLLKSGASPTLPTAVSNTSVYQIKNVHTAGIQLSTTSNQTVEGAPPPLISPGESYTLISDNDNWWII